MARLKSFLFHLYSILFCMTRPKPAARYDAVIIRVDAIGDYVVWRDALSAYRQRFAGARVALICAEVVRPLAELDPLFCRVYGIEKGKAFRDFTYFRRLLRQCRSIEAGQVIYPAWARQKIGDILVEAVQSREKVGMKGYAWKRSFAQTFHNRAYTRLLENPDTDYEIESVEFFTRTAILPTYRYGLNPWQLPAPPKGWADRSYIVFAISSNDLDRIWPAERFAALADQIPDAYQLLFTGSGDADRLRVSQVLTLMKSRDRASDLVGKTDVVELSGLISRARMVVGNDSSAVHIAAATHVPSLCITRRCTQKIFVPYPDGLPFPQFNPRVVSAEKLSDVSVDMAKEALDAMLNQ